MSNKFGDHESIMHVIADELVEHFEGVGAVNYIEQIFTDKNDPCKSFVLTMQMVNGLTPCEKLNAANELIAKQAKQIKILREAVILARPHLFINSVEDSKAEYALESTKDSL